MHALFYDALVVARALGGDGEEVSERGLCPGCRLLSARDPPPLTPPLRTPPRFALRGRAWVQGK